ncbi:ABC transporter permease [Alkalicoccobacillus murimartini]|uniref:Transport permease protein n=1 Tax=Alkalicoccobacillus murimartini TaxID=171685 RepID=A0ABT9YG61_9BACI|nr:ABC transporter permease [Alkalicoccobacillus murimartini]MDQ0206810.1 ABC-2 type transport system permease protein [Alkalicoccobacillus murimartini]
MKEILRYKELLYFLVHKELRIRYRNTFFGYFWTLLEPLGLMLIFTLVFMIIARVSIENYTLFLVSGLIPFMYTQHTISRGTKSLTGNGSLIKKIYFPRELFPLTITASSLVNLLISLVLVAAYSLYINGSIPLMGLAVLPLVIILQTFLLLGIVFIFSCVNVYFRDVEFIVGLMMRGWMYLSAVMYPLLQVKEQLGGYFILFQLNPMVTILTIYRWIFHGGELTPTFGMIIYTVIFSLVIFFVGWRFFKVMSRKIGEVI